MFRGELDRSSKNLDNKILEAQDRTMKSTYPRVLSAALLTLSATAGCDPSDEEHAIELSDDEFADDQHVDEQSEYPDIDRVDDHGTIDDLTASLHPSKVIYGVWTPLVGTQNCFDMFTQPCSGSVPNQQCEVGSVCEWTPGATCFKVLSPATVRTMRCKK